MEDGNEDADHSGHHCRSSSSILYESDGGTIVLLDIPRTLEESQALLPSRVPSRVPPASTRRIISAQPVEAPFDTPDPKCTPPTAATTNPASQIAHLMTAAAVQSALDHLHTSYIGAFHLPRIVAHGEGTPPLPATGGEDPFVPDKATALHGSLQDLSETLRDSAPAFDLIILDPPWPNRSARRRTDGYSTVSSLADMAQLLDHVPVPSHLAAGGLVAVWITNNASVLDFVTSRSGLFASWGLELVAEWTWLKVTASGEPIFALDSTWRKPWEKLLIAKRVGVRAPVGLGSSSKTIIAVPDVHSRKPNLRGLFIDILGPGFTGLEVFARNLTAGWWSWGDEVLQFQQPQHWVASNLAEQ